MLHSDSPHKLQRAACTLDWRLFKTCYSVGIYIYLQDLSEQMRLPMRLFSLEVPNSRSSPFDTDCSPVDDGQKALALSLPGGQLPMISAALAVRLSAVLSLLQLLLHLQQHRDKHGEGLRSPVLQAKNISC